MANNITDTSLTEVLRGLVKQTIDASSQANVFFGTVVTTNPLTINVEQRFTLTQEFFILTKNVKNYTTTATINWNTEYKTAGDTNHNHSINGTKTITINNGLKENDKVILLQVQGGQKYIVLDKVV